MKFLFLSLIAMNLYAFDQDYKSWDKFLKKYTVVEDKQTLVKYKEIDKEDLKSILSEFEAVSKKDFKAWSKNQKLAFWINAYNAYTIQLILKHYPVKSIKDIGSLFSTPWSKEFINLLGKEMSLDDIEHETIRKNFKEPLIHFAVNCASIGCPSLSQSAFVGERIREQLAAAEKHFLNNKNKNQLRGNVIFVSKIFKWFGDDFGGYEPMKAYFKRRLVFEVKEIEYLDYNWNLNEKK